MVLLEKTFRRVTMQGLAPTEPATIERYLISATKTDTLCSNGRLHLRARHSHACPCEKAAAGKVARLQRSS